MLSAKEHGSLKNGLSHIFDNTITYAHRTPDKKLGTTDTRPALDCEAIKIANPDSIDGEYWIKPLPGSAVQKTWCDMTTDGGVGHL